MQGRVSKRSKEHGGWTVKLRAESHSSMQREGPGCDTSVHLGSRELLQPALRVKTWKSLIDFI